MPIFYTQLASSISPLLLVSNDASLRQIIFVKNGSPTPVNPEWKESPAALREPIRQLRAYFAGELEAFDLPLAPEGTPFQQKVWRELGSIPFGTTISYGEQARRIGRPQAARAVGAANGRNPVPVVLPCHRVIGSAGALTGFGGGLDTKRTLLRHEAEVLAAER